MTKRTPKGKKKEKKRKKKSLGKPDVSYDEPAIKDYLSITEKGEATTINVSFSKLPSPSRTYSADRALISKRFDEFRIVFLQCDPLTDRALTAVSVLYSRHNFHKMMERCSSGFFDLVAKVVLSKNANDEDLSKKEAVPESAVAKCLTERASFERMAFHEGDAEIEFYFLSPARMNDLGNNTIKEGIVNPVLSVTLSVRELHNLLKEGKRLVLHE